MVVTRISPQYTVKIPDEFRLRRINSMGIQVTTRQVGDVSVVDVVGRITLGDLLQIAKLDTVFEVFDSETSAMHSFA